MSIQRRDSRSYEGICSGFVSRRAPPSIVLLLRLARSPSLTSNRLITINADCDGDPHPKTDHEIPDAMPTFG
jgi:hypothetical protein